MANEYVNYDDIKEDVDSMTKNATQLNDALERIMSSYNSLPDSWKGNAGSSFYSDLEKLAGNFTDAHGKLLMSILFLAGVGDGYDKIDQTTLQKMQAEASNYANGGTMFDGSESGLVGNASSTKTSEENVNSEEPVDSDENTVVIEGDSEETTNTDVDDVTNGTTVVKSSDDEKVGEEVGKADTKEEETPKSDDTDKSTKETKPAEEKVKEEVKPAEEETTAETGNSNDTEWEVRPYKEISEEELTEVAKAVIHGDYSNDAERIEMLKADGYDPDVVQQKVNELMRSK